jgi:hypothetical protein
MIRPSILTAFALICGAASTHAQQLSADELARRTIERRAVEAVVWGMPAVNYELMYQAMVRETKGGFNQIVYWSRLPDWKNQTLTPNPDAIYLMPFISTSDAGPVVIEIPPADEGSITGTIMDSWQVPLADVGPAGIDAGKGGKYVVLPPGFTGTAPSGYVALASVTIRAMRSCARYRRAAATATSPRPPTTAGASRSIRCRRQRTRRRRPSSMQSTSSTMRPFPMISASSCPC